LTLKGKPVDELKSVLMDFSRANLIGMIEACYSLEEEWLNLQIDEDEFELTSPNRLKLDARRTGLATTLEGLLLDKKNKDDLSARLQDAVAYLLGGSRDTRTQTRRIVRDLYSARSAFVHNGELDPKVSTSSTQLSWHEGFS